MNHVGSAEGTIAIRLNGKDRNVPAGISVEQLIEHLGLHPAMVVVELNRDILERGRYGSEPVRDGDHIELVHFVGGG